jgi:hypothetical protein
VEYTPANIGAAGDFTVGIPCGQAGGVGLLIQGAAAQTGNLLRLQNSAATILAGVTADGYGFLGGAGASTSTALNLSAGTTAISSARMAHGVAPTTPVDGDIWTTTKGLYLYINGATVGPINSTGTTAATSIIGTGIGSVTIPADYLTAGKKICVRATLRSARPTTAHTVSFIVTFGTYTATLTTTSGVGNPYYHVLTAEFTPYTAGASVTIAGSMEVSTTAQTGQLINTGTAAAFNTTAATTLTITVTNNNTAVTTSCYQLNVESLFF